MARKKAGAVPQLQQHKGTGQGKVHLGGRDFYCGKWGSPECKAKYDRLIAEWLHNGRRPPERPNANRPHPTAPPPASVISTICGSMTSYFVGLRRGTVTSRPRNPSPLGIVQRSLYRNSHMVTVGSSAEGIGREGAVGNPPHCVRIISGYMRNIHRT